MNTFVSISVPPDILDAESSKDISVNEGQNASLFCVASGNPHPRKSIPPSRRFCLWIIEIKTIECFWRVFPEIQLRGFNLRRSTVWPGLSLNNS